MMLDVKFKRPPEAAAFAPAALLNSRHATNPVLGHAMHELARELFPICRSITGDGQRQSLDIIKRYLTGLTSHSVPTGTPCFDWEVPREWNIRDAYIIDPTGRKIASFTDNNLHVVGYSIPIHTTMPLAELEAHLHSLPAQPKAIPYITSYYKERWGFCLSDEQRQTLQPGNYEVYIDSSLASGHLTYGELLIPGKSDDEVFISTYLCHPSMANNELSGPVVAVFLAQWLLAQTERRYSYRIIFIPETIGSLVYLSKHASELRRRVRAAFNLTCVGDDRAYSYLPSRLGNTLTDRVILHTLKSLELPFTQYSFLERGSDERQYCSPGIDLPVASLMRSKYGTFPEYHTSLDDLKFVTPTGLFGAYRAHLHCLRALEDNEVLVAQCLGEPQLGKRGLYPDLGTKDAGRYTRNLLNILSYCDGQHDLLAIADLIGEPIWEVAPIAAVLKEQKLLAAPAANFPSL